MGGVGSGRNGGFLPKATTAAHLQIDVRRWARDGLLEPNTFFVWRWSFPGGRGTSIDVTVKETGMILGGQLLNCGGTKGFCQYVPLTITPCHFGGERTWFLCPNVACRRRAAILYDAPQFACRTCHDLAYPSQREPLALRELSKKWRSYTPSAL